MSNWNSQLATTAPCSGVTFTTGGGNASISVNYAAINSSSTGTIVRGQTYLDSAIFSSGTSGSRLNHVDMNIDTGVTSPDEVFAHEIGHTFALNDCNRCGLHSTVMETGDQVTSENDLIGRPGPTACDVNAVLTVATDYACSGGGGQQQQNCSLNCNPCGSTCLNCVNCTSGTPTCVLQSGGWMPACNTCPIIIDASGQGFHLTDLAGGVPFRLSGSAPTTQMSWTDAKYGNAWLVLDRNNNGQIDDMTELFGTSTPQPGSPDPNGYKALAVFDDPRNGGNGNGKIDPGDAVYRSLRVWIDRNHNGISDPGELIPLAEAGVFGISLDYSDSTVVDQYGNQFRYQSRIWDRQMRATPTAYDVFILIRPENTTHD